MVGLMVTASRWLAVPPTGAVAPRLGMPPEAVSRTTRAGPCIIGAANVRHLPHVDAPTLAVVARRAGAPEEVEAGAAAHVRAPRAVVRAIPPRLVTIGVAVAPAVGARPTVTIVGAATCAGGPSVVLAILVRIPTLARVRPPLRGEAVEATLPPATLPAKRVPARERVAAALAVCGDESALVLAVVGVLLGTRVRRRAAPRPLPRPRRILREGEVRMVRLVGVPLGPLVPDTAMVTTAIPAVLMAWPGVRLVDAPPPGPADLETARAIIRLASRLAVNGGAQVPLALVHDGVR